LLAAAVPLLSQLLFHAKNMSKVELPGFFLANSCIYTQRCRGKNFQPRRNTSGS
jgi:hypothetical protein